jgi:hypothetical protein
MSLSIGEKNEEEKVTLEKLYSEIQKNIVIEDLKNIDIILAVALSSKMKDTIPLWLINIAPSGFGKTLLTMMLEGNNTFILHNLTARTLVNGHELNKKNAFPDLAPRLDGKIVIIPDMAQILKLHPNEKAEVWAQLRDLYDGYAGKNSGMGLDQKYSGLRITLIACSTPSIDSQILINQDLGTRELLYRNNGYENKKNVMEMCLKNIGKEKEIKKRISELTKKFLDNRIPQQTELTNEIKEKIMQIALFTTKLRTSAEFDSHDNELRNFVTPEEPTRILKQFAQMFYCLKSLDDKYSDKKAIEVIQRLSESSCSPTRLKLYKYFESHRGEIFTTSKLSKEMNVGKGTIKRECSVLKALKIIKYEAIPEGYKEIDNWWMHENPLEVNFADVFYSRFPIAQEEKIESLTEIT